MEIYNDYDEKNIYLNELQTNFLNENGYVVINDLCILRDSDNNYSVYKIYKNWNKISLK